MPIPAIKDSSTIVQAVPKPPASFFSRWRKQILTISAVAVAIIGVYLAYRYYSSPIMSAPASLQEAAPVMSAPASLSATTTPVISQDESHVLLPACSEIKDLPLFKNNYEFVKGWFTPFPGTTRICNLEKLMAEQLACCKILQEIGKLRGVVLGCWISANNYVENCGIAGFIRAHNMY